LANNISGINPVGTPSALDTFNASNQAISMKEQLPDLAQKLRDALTSKFQENPLWSQYQTASQNFMAAPANIRNDINSMQQTSGVPLSPTQQQAIESSRRAAAFAPLQTSSLMLSNAQGGLENMVGSGVKAFEAAANAQGERADLMNKMRQQEFERQLKEKQLSIDLAKLAIQQQGGNLSAGERLQGKTALAALKQLNTFKQNYGAFRNTGPLSGTLTNLFKNFLPKSKLVDPYLASMESDIGPLRDSLLNAISGANVSSQEADRVKAWIPSNTKSTEENTRNLNSLEAWLNDKYSSLTNTQYSPGGNTWEIVQ
jgi:hypothetical protein